MRFIPGLEPDFDVRRELLFFGGALDLRQFDKIFISISGGKDSHAMTFLVAELAERQGVRDRLVGVYSDTGMEWHNAEDQVRSICLSSKIPLQVVYPIRPMLDKFAHRIYLAKMGLIDAHVFPSPSCRYCTSQQKVAPMDKYIRKHNGKLLKITGERWEESTKRASYSEFVKVDRLTNSRRRVYGWRPILQWKLPDVWKKIAETNVPRHCAYDLGCGRLGCAGCIFSTDHELKIEMNNNPIIFESLDRLEIDSGFTISMTKKRIRDRLKI